MNLEHACSLEWTNAKAADRLLQLGPLFFPWLEPGRLLHALALACAQTSAARRWGGQDKPAQRLREALRYFLPPEAATEPPCRISFGAAPSRVARLRGGSRFKRAPRRRRRPG